VLERTVSLEIGKAYAELKAALVRNGCRISSEESPKRLFARQGSLWGMTPKTAKKTIDANLATVDGGTQIKCRSSISSDWKSIALIGSILAAALVGVCVWMSFDLSAFMANAKPNFWSWLATVNGTVDLQVAQSLVNLTKTLAAFLSVIILFEIADTVYVNKGIDKFTQEALNTFPGRSV
jgi:hypothetical protein